MGKFLQIIFWIAILVGICLDPRLDSPVLLVAAFGFIISAMFYFYDLSQGKHMITKVYSQQEIADLIQEHRANKELSPEKDTGIILEGEYQTPQSIDELSNPIEKQGARGWFC